MKEPHLEVEARPWAHERQSAPPGAPRQSAVDCLSRVLAASGEPRTSLGAPVNGVCAGLALRDTFRALFVGELLGCRVGWPQLVRAGRDHADPGPPRGHVDEWLRDGDVLVELARPLPSEPFELAIVLPASVAVHLGDRLLGAPSSSGMASRVGAPSDAECGVLAYAAARLAAAHAGDWLVRDVRRSTRVGADDLVLWPIVIDTTVGKLELMLCLSRSLASAMPAVELHTLLHERMGNDGAPVLAVDEVWVSDRLPLTQTSLGLTGPVTLRVPDCEQLVAARLSEHYVECTPESARPTPDELDVELLITARVIDFLALAALASGARCFVGEVGREPVSVRHRGQTVARGELVVWRGAIGVRITET